MYVALDCKAALCLRCTLKGRDKNVLECIVLYVIEWSSLSLILRAQGHTNT